MSGQIPECVTPWSSSYTKIAAAATYQANVDPNSNILPQVIWDSRVSYAMTRLASRALAHEPGVLLGFKQQLLVVPGRGGNRFADGPWTMELRQQGWSFATGSWRLRSKAFWRSQTVGSRLIHAIAGKLNNLSQFECERRNGHRWTSFDVGLA
jgi:hypothetical protein